MKTVFLYTGAAISILIFTAVTSFTAGVFEAEQNNKQIIKFSHSFHIELETDCASCHTKVAESNSLTDRLLPEKEACAGCHDVEDEENCTQCHFEEIYEPLIQKKSELIFDHEFHISNQNLECESCHKGLDEVDYSFESTEAFPPMNNCYSCHNETSNATNSCEACHISTANLLPLDHKTVSFFDTHKFTAMNSNADCAMCHDNSFCEACHVGTTTINETNTASDFYTPYSPHTYKDNQKQQQITRVHDLNYRFVHGIDAKGKSAECQTCHQTETFCVECHGSSGGDFALEGFVPTSHTVPNFTTIGVGTGGGEHAVMAKRDIENCASCHDVQGGDANCILCHVDNDGIKGTDHKTHDLGFLDDVEGDWHDSDGSVCYSCHVTSSASTGIRGVGFCGYCHQ